MQSNNRDIKLQLFCVAVCGHTLTVLFFVGLVLFAKLLPAPSPLASAQEISLWYQEHAVGVRVGMSLQMISLGFWAPWAAVLAVWTRRVEPFPPLLSYIQVASLAVSLMVAVMFTFFWGMAAFRPGEIAPEITMTLNDMGWLMFLLPWPPYSVWHITVGLAILWDRSEYPMFPKWVAGMSFLTAFIYVPAILPLTFKSGGFAYDGLLGCYIPLFVFFIWIESVTFTMIASLKRELKRREQGHPPSFSSALDSLPVNH